ncbi:MAG: YjjW family glycine radical enzyme activase [Erysipelotrichaceae bacterium]|nr:YjjW family glycine radical enzyme activase [Erysipelotrichaceae bacterium]
MIAPINNIIPFSNVDGPGNRTSIFFQGCPFQCLYCHNPETINICNNCGVCVDHCPVNALEFINDKVVWNKKKCISCDTCIKVCPHLSSPKITYMSVDQVFEEILKYRQFIKGITTSGGECMVYADFLTELFEKCVNIGLDCLLDSNGHYDFKKYEKLLKYSSGVMLDVKAMDKDFHRYVTKMPNENVINNLLYLQSINKLFEVRTVVLPNNKEHNENTINKLSEILNSDISVKLIKYRPFGVRKEGIDKIGNSITSDEEVNRLFNIAKSKGLKNVVII